MRDLKEGRGIGEQSKEDKENECCVFIQRRIRGILARKYVNRMRVEEMEFLGMITRKKTPEELRDDPIKKMLAYQKERKLIQISHLAQYNDAREAIQEEIDNNQGTDIME